MKNKYFIKMDPLIPASPKIKYRIPKIRPTFLSLNEEEIDETFLYVKNTDGSIEINDIENDKDQSNLDSNEENSVDNSDENSILNTLKILNKNRKKF